MFNQGTSTDTKVAVLEEKVSIYEQMMRKIEDAIYAISETSQGISKMLAIHEERLEQAIKTDGVIIKLVDDLKKTVEAEDTDLSDRIDEIVIMLEEVNKVRWMTIGIGTVLALLVAAGTQLIGGILTPSQMGYRMEHRYVPSPENITK